MTAAPCSCVADRPGQIGTIDPDHSFRLLAPEGIADWAWARIAKRDGARWSIAERDGSGEIIGTAYRNGAGRKDFAVGGKRGLILPWPLEAYAGTTAGAPVFVAEGASDTAALLSIGLDAIGVAMAGACGPMLAELIADRHVVIVADNDEAGRRGARKIGETLRNVCRSVRIIKAPLGAKDARQAVVKGAGPEAFMALVAQADPLTRANDATDGAPILVRMADVAPRPVSWLWEGRLPRRCVSVLAGRPGDGKSFATADWAARVSTGTAWPDGTPAPRGDVLLVSGEDDPETVLRPRLDAHKADVNRIHLMRAVRRIGRNGRPTEVMFTLDDLPALEAALKQLRDPALCVIDPIGSFLGRSVDAHRDNEVRGVLAPLNALAERFGIAMLVVAHHSKSNMGRADDLILGSRAFSGLARMVLHLLRDPQDEDRRLLLPGKSNLTRAPAGLGFHIAGEPVRLVWEAAPVELSADEILAAMSERQASRGVRAEAKEWLRDVLAPGPQSAADVKEWAERDGIKLRTLDRAKSELGVSATREGYSTGGRWVWAMPSDAPGSPQDAKQGTLAHNGDVGALWNNTKRLQPAIGSGGGGVRKREYTCVVGSSALC